MVILNYRYSPMNELRLIQFINDDEIDYAMKELNIVIGNIKNLPESEILFQYAEFIQTLLDLPLNTLETVLLISFIRCTYSLRHCNKGKWSTLHTQITAILNDRQVSKYALRGIDPI